MSIESLSKSAPAPRLCHIIKWTDFDGYGFNLHTEKGKPGQYIGKVDDNSPAEAAGLKEGDRIIEVNGVNIFNESHKQVVLRIKTMSEETKLLVVDSETDNFYKDENIVISSSLPNIIYLRTPDKSHTSHNLNGQIFNNVSQIDNYGSNGDSEVHSEKGSMKGSSNATTPSSDRKRSLVSTPEPADYINDETSTNPGDTLTSGESTLAKNMKNTTLNLNMSAKELRAQLAARKKYDPKKESMDIKKKHDIIEKL